MNESSNSPNERENQMAKISRIIQDNQDMVEIIKTLVAQLQDIQNRIGVNDRQLGKLRNALKE